MSTTEEATVNPDGSTTFEGGDETFDAKDEGGDDFGAGEGEEILVTAGTDPAIYLGLFVVLLAAMYFLIYHRRKKSNGDSFFDDLDGEKVSASPCLPYYTRLQTERLQSKPCYSGGWRVEEQHLECSLHCILHLPF